MIECVSSTADSLRAAMHEAFFRTSERPTQDKQHGLSKKTYLDMKTLSACLKL